MRALLASALVVATCATAVGCWVEPAPRRNDSPPATTTPAPAPTTPASDPVKVAIDTDRTLHASPGAGAGVFITYSAGGTWNISWTCDSNVAGGRTCDWELAVNSTGLKSLSSEPTSAVSTQDATSFSVHTSTAATLDSATFTTEPGSPITFSMRLGGQPYPNLVWYVSDGNLVTAPTDPIELVPTAP